VWDNNNNKDFHSPVEAAATSDSMVEMVFQVTRGAAGAEWAGRWGGGGEELALSVVCPAVRLAPISLHFRLT
jgi:hypothetical protein